MLKELKELVQDLENLDLPRDFESAFDKIKCPLINGKRIYWYYKEDVNYCKEVDEDPKKYSPYSGIIICAPNREIRYEDDELETEDCVVVIDKYPTEKCYPETEWIALNRLLDDEDLVEIYELEKII